MDEEEEGVGEYEEEEEEDDDEVEVENYFHAALAAMHREDALIFMR